MSDERLTLTVEETAEILGIGRASAYAACAAGELPTVKLGRRILVPRARLLAMLGQAPELSPNANEPAADRLAAEAAEATRHGPV